MKTRDRYVSVNGAWPEPSAALPPLTPAMARKAFRALYRHRFHTKWKLPVKAVAGARRRTWYDFIPKGKGGSMGMIVAPDAGWHSFIHDLSHWMHARQYPKQKAHHGSSHPAVEKDLIEEVVNRGWLEESRKAVQQPSERRARPKPDKRALALARTRKRLARWRTKAKRAATAIKKLEAAERRLTKAMALRDAA